VTPATRLPNNTDAVTLLANCVANIDVWTEPLSIATGSYSLTLSSSALANVACAITGSGSVTLNGVQYNH